MTLLLLLRGLGRDIVTSMQVPLEYTYRAPGGLRFAHILFINNYISILLQAAPFILLIYLFESSFS